MKKTFLFFIILISTTISAKGKYNIIVDQQGNGNFTTIQKAIDSIRAFNPAGEVTIFVKKGVYKEKLVIPTHACMIHLIGEDVENTVITYNDGAQKDKMGTFKTYSVLIQGNDITVENLTIENNAPTSLGQAVALHVEGDRIVFIHCRFLGNQDTIYTGRENSRMLFYQCYIEGTTDFIFGPSTAWFEECTIKGKSNSYLTAASTPKNIKYGYIFNKCTILLDKNVSAEYLGRPWRAYSMTLFMNCNLPKGIKPQGWNNWSNVENEKTTRYMEYNNSGEGADISQRAKWAKILTKKQASIFTIENVLKGYDNWKPITEKAN